LAFQNGLHHIGHIASFAIVASHHCATSCVIIATSLRRRCARVYCRFVIHCASSFRRRRPRRASRRCVVDCATSLHHVIRAAPLWRFQMAPSSVVRRHRCVTSLRHVVTTSLLRHCTIVRHVVAPRTLFAA
jgi:hypothetical protein